MGCIFICANSSSIRGRTSAAYPTYMFYKRTEHDVDCYLLCLGESSIVTNANKMHRKDIRIALQVLQSVLDPFESGGWAHSGRCCDNCMFIDHI